MPKIMLLLLGLCFGALAAYGVVQRRLHDKMWGAPLAVGAGVVSFFSIIAINVSLSLMLILAAVAMLANAEAKKGDRTARVVALGAGALAVLMALGSVMYTLGGCRTRGESAKRSGITEGYLEAQAYIVGKYLAEKHPQSKVVTVVNHSDPHGSARLDALKAGAGALVSFAADERVGSPELEAEDAGGGTDDIFTQRRLDDIQQQHDCDMIISFSGLPEDYAHAVRAAATASNNRGKLKLVLVGITSEEITKAQVKRGEILAFVTWLPHPSGSAESSPPPGDKQEAFDCRYLLVDRDNVDAVAAEHGLQWRR